MIRKQTLAVILSSAAFFGVGECQTCPVRDRLPSKPPAVSAEQNPVDRYALLVFSVTDQNSKYTSKASDSDTIALAKVYKALIDNGYSDRHIFILYSWRGKTPNFEMIKDKELASRLESNHFQSSYYNEARESNIESILDALKERVDDNDKFVFYIMAHGRNYNIYNYMQLESGGRIYPYELQSYLNGWKSNSNWFVIMSCYGGNLIDLCDVDNVCLVAGSETGKLAWADRDWCTGERFITYLADKKCDSDRDGVVETSEVIDKLCEDADIYWAYLRWYITKYYKDELEADDVSLLPKIKVGKNFKEANMK